VPIRFGGRIKGGLRQASQFREPPRPRFLTGVSRINRR
jgi:hypothetical protein